MSRRHLCKQLFNLIGRQGRESSTLTCTRHRKQAFDIHSVCRCLPACFSTTSRDHQHHSHNSPIRNESANTFTYRSHLCGTLNLTQEGQKVTLHGWVDRVTGYFLKVYDWSGLVQILLTDEWLDKLSDLERESVICVTGVVRARPAGQENKTMATGEIEIIPEDVRVLNACRPNRPLEPRSHQQITERVRSRYRYLDIRNQQMQHNLRLRSALIMKMREFLCNVHGFVDVETPTLFRKTPGGAKEFIVPSRYPGKFYSLPQSPQQFKQLLMVGGIDRYFQVARCYRDELSKPDRQPEFTQLDIEMSFASQSHIRGLIEGLLQYCWPASELGKIDTNFPEMTYAEAMRDYGTDKPDIRFDMKLVDVTDACKSCGNRFLEEADCVQAIRIPDGAKYLSNKDIDGLLISPLEEEPVKMISIKFKDGGQWRSSAGNTMTDDSKREISRTLGVDVQDLAVLAVGKGESANKVLGRLRLETASLLEEKGIRLREDGVYKFLWVVDFPLFLPKEDEDYLKSVEGHGSKLTNALHWKCLSPVGVTNLLLSEGDTVFIVADGVESAHHPFTAPHDEDAGLVYSDSDILKVRSQHYDLVLNGSEIGGGSVRIHDAQLQRHVLQHVLKEDPSELKHLLDALELGCPPHTGIALGLDRLVAIMCGAKSIRDVIAFPKFGVDKDPMSEAPVALSDDELATYHLQVIKS